MNLELLIMGTVLSFLAYFVGLKKATWLLAGYNERRVLNKERLAKSVGITYGISALWLFIWGLIGVSNMELFGGIAVGFILLQLIYVQIKMVV